MRKTLFALLLLASAAPAFCPISIKCSYHNTNAYKVDTEYRNGKHFGIYEHDIIASDKKCRILIECER